MKSFLSWTCNPPDPLQSPATGNPENAIFDTKNGLFGGATWTHLNTSPEAEITLSGYLILPSLSKPC